MRVIVVDDVMLTRAGIVRLLTDAGVEVVAESEDAVTLHGLVGQLHPDSVVLDIRMPPTHMDEGLVAATQIRDAYPDVSVLLLSHHVEPRYAMNSWRGRWRRSDTSSSSASSTPPSLSMPCDGSRKAMSSSIRRS